MKEFLVKESSTIKQCLLGIDQNEYGIIFIINTNDEVIGVATDGDIRSHLLKGANLEDPIIGVYNPNFIWANTETKREAILKRLDKDIKAIPMLDKNRKLIDVVTRDYIPINSEKKIFTRSRAPVRITFSGGGSDLTHYFSSQDGAVINTTISLYSHASLKIRDDKRIKIHSLDLGDIFEANNLQEALEKGNDFALFKSLLKAIKPNFGFDLLVYSDFPMGSGLGGSSVVSAAVLGCFNELRQDKWDLYEISELAFQAERLHMEISGGWQDQYATVFGGFNFMEFRSGSNIINPLRISKDTILELEESLLLFRASEDRLLEGDVIHKKQKKDMQSQDVRNKVKSAVNICYEMKDHLLKNRLLHFGELLDKAWKLKRKFSSDISNPKLDNIYQHAISHGALGGKLLGAGGGGYFIFFVKPFDKLKLIEAMKNIGLYHTPFQFDHDGMKSWSVRDE
tara:strand:+ start:1754 stop:3115 length:1362 start_codon:yes stop_codon:yes gene_type:complete